MVQKMANLIEMALHRFDSLSKNPNYSRILAFLSIIFFLIFVIGPLFFIFAKLEFFTFNLDMQNAILTSFTIAAIVTLVDLVFGIPLAWFLSHKKTPLSGLIDTIVDLPLVVPSSALGLSIALFWGNGGISLFQPGLEMIILLHIAITFSYVVRTTQAAIIGVEPDLARASSSLGASPLLSFRTIWLPLFKAGAISGAILAFSRSLGETGATIIVAGAFKTVPVMAVQYKNAIPPEMNSAISLASIFVMLSAILFILARSMLGSGKFSLGKIYADAERRLSKYAPAANLSSLSFFLFFVILPSFFFLKFTDFNFLSPSTVNALITSFIIASVATLAAVVFGLPLAMYIASKKPGSGTLKLLANMALLMPTVTIGLSVFLYWEGKIDELGLLILTHIAIVTPYFITTVSEVLEEMSTSLREVARSLGATPLYAFRTVVFPILKPTFMAGMIVAFMRSIAETGGNLAASKNIITIPILIVNLSKSDHIGQAASAAVLLLVVSIAVVAIIRRKQNK